SWSHVSSNTVVASGWLRSSTYWRTRSTTWTISISFMRSGESGRRSKGHACVILVCRGGAAGGVRRCPFDLAMAYRPHSASADRTAFSIGGPFRHVRNLHHLSSSLSCTGIARKHASLGRQKHHTFSNLHLTGNDAAARGSC